MGATGTIGKKKGYNDDQCGIGSIQRPNPYGTLIASMTCRKAIRVHVGMQDEIAVHRNEQSQRKSAEPVSARNCQVARRVCRDIGVCRYA